MAILTAAEVREFIPALTGTTDDTLLNKLIASVGTAIAVYLGYPRVSASSDPTIESATYTLYSGGYGGRVVVDGDRLIFPVRPISSITSITDDPDQGYGTSYLVASGDYTYNAIDGVVRALPTSTHGAWSPAPYAIKAVVVAGWLAAGLPTDILMAARLTVRHWYELRSRGPSTQISAEGVSVSPQDIAIPSQAKALLDPYRLASAWVA